MAGLSKEEYLKRYLSPSNSEEPKKKKRKKKVKNISKRQGMKIFDDDVSWDNIAPKSDDEFENKLLTADEKPQVTQIDIRTEEEKKLDAYKRSKMWKKLGSSDNEANSSFHNKLQTKQRYDSDSDLEVERPEISQRHDSDSDIDVPRTKSDSRRHDSGSRVGKSKSSRTDSDSDLDLSRPTRHDSDSDFDVDKNPKNRNDSDSDLDVKRATSKRKKDMIGGGKGGLTDVRSLRDEMKERKLKESQLDKLAEQYKESATVRRENGRRVDLSKEKEEEDKKNEKRKRKEEQYSRWGKGLKQATLISEAVSNTMHESNKPLARYQDDDDLEKMRREEVRAGDPMAEYIARKKQQENGSKAKVLPKYRGPAPAPNRFNIMPGYRWDGVDRSNGFEKKYYTSLSDQIALNDEMYKWSVGDM